jgi:hypothetical protein
MDVNEHERLSNITIKHKVAWETVNISNCFMGYTITCLIFWISIIGLNTVFQEIIYV